MGKGVKDFEDLEIYKKGKELVLKIYQITSAAEFEKEYSLKNQMRRAGISVVSNIAEGFDRGSKEFKRYLDISRGSSFELRCQLSLAWELGYISDEDYYECREQCETLAAMIKGLMNYLQTKTARH